MIMSEKDKQTEKERKGVVELLLKKNGLTRRKLVEELVGFWLPAGHYSYPSIRRRKRTTRQCGITAYY